MPVLSTQPRWRVAAFRRRVSSAATAASCSRRSATSSDISSRRATVSHRRRRRRRSQEAPAVRRRVPLARRRRCCRVLTATRPTRRPGRSRCTCVHTRCRAAARSAASRSRGRGCSRDIYARTLGNVPLDASSVAVRSPTGPTCELTLRLTRPPSDTSAPAVGALSPDYHFSSATNVTLLPAAAAIAIVTTTLSGRYQATDSDKH